MRIQFLAVLILFAISYPAFAGDLTSGVDCNGTMPIPENYEVESLDKHLIDTFYTIPGEEVSFENESAQHINYVYQDDEFLYKLVSLYGNDNIQATMRYLQKEYGHGHLSTKDSYRFWFSRDHVFSAKRYDLHLAKLIILCRDTFTEKNELPPDFPGTFFK